MEKVVLELCYNVDVGPLFREYILLYPHSRVSYKCQPFPQCQLQATLNHNEPAQSILQYFSMFLQLLLKLFSFDLLLDCV